MSPPINNNIDTKESRLLESLEYNCGSLIIDALNDADVIEIMLNPDGNLWIEKYGQDQEFIGRIEIEQSKLILSLVASALKVTVNNLNPIVEGSFPLDGSRFEGTYPPMTESAQKPWTVNVAGKSFRLKNKVEALQVIYAARKRGLSHDIGLMQINSWWLKRLKITPEIALEPRNNVKLGVFILAQEIRRYGFGWKAVGAYHSPTLWRQKQYAYKVANHYKK